MLRFVTLCGLAASLSVAPTRSDARCATVRLGPSLLSSSGAFVVGLGPRADDSSGEWSLDGKPLAGGVVVAPGLTVYHPAPRAILRDGSGKTVAVLGSPTVRKLAAPTIKRIIGEITVGGRGSSQFVDVDLSDAIPAGVVALIMIDHDGKPLTWSPVAPGERRVRLLERSRCGVLPTGSRMPTDGERVRLVWLDDSGVPSAQSAEVNATIRLRGRRGDG